MGEEERAVIELSCFCMEAKGYQLAPTSVVAHLTKAAQGFSP